MVLVFHKVGGRDGGRGWVWKVKWERAGFLGVGGGLEGPGREKWGK